MVKTIILCLLSIFFISNCVSPTKIHTWNLNWGFRNIKDSTYIYDTLITKVSITPDLYNGGPWIDTISNGILLVHLYLNGEENEFLSKSPVLYLNCKIMSDILIDTLFNWSACEFKSGVDQMGNKNQNVSKKVFYLVK